MPEYDTFAEFSRDSRATDSVPSDPAALEEASDLRFYRWAMGDLNPRPLPCEGSALAS